MPKYPVTQHEVVEVAKRLDRSYPRTELDNKEDPLDEAVFILLTSQTDEDKYLRSWEKLRTVLPNWQAVVNTSEEAIFDAIKDGGLGRWKAARIMKLMHQTKDLMGEYSLNNLAVLDDASLERTLVSLDGIAIKGARCIMMYSFHRSVFPVDAHVDRIAKRIGFEIPDASNRSKKYANALQEQVPPDLRHRLHVNMIQHGRAICKARKPRCEICTINDICRYGIEVKESLELSDVIPEDEERLEN